MPTSRPAVDGDRPLLEHERDRLIDVPGLGLLGRHARDDRSLHRTPRRFHVVAPTSRTGPAERLRADEHRGELRLSPPLDAKHGTPYYAAPLVVDLVGAKDGPDLFVVELDRLPLYVTGAMDEVLLDPGDDQRRVCGLVEDRSKPSALLIRARFSLASGPF